MSFRLPKTFGDARTALFNTFYLYIPCLTHHLHLQCEHQQGVFTIKFKMSDPVLSVLLLCVAGYVGD